MKLSEILRLPAAACLRQGCSQTSDCLQNRTESGYARYIQSESDEVLQSTCKVGVCHKATGHESEGSSLLGSTGNNSTLLLATLAKANQRAVDGQRFSLEVWL